MLNKAREFAIKAHGEQKYGSEPYIVHLDAVVNNLQAYDQTAQIVGYLHDVMEDTEITYEDIKENFGGFVADCVAIVTDEPDSNRKERKAKTYEKMANVTGDLELALIVKAADRLANLQACIKGGNAKLLNQYRDEQSAFKTAAYRRNKCEDIWQEIERIINLE
ncbi:HD domain-containing protein [Spartinivicinus poritis]|uniref:HD domain-containing protein n=1 Tax=Spartinivicinus poritis TaxID=2994640 RepID=A0ABT5UGZ8_9GAMM|nr:HD domain-containing protein [Spartinivicinus sp. A2-2]MDE1465587.1 HD domain-containing protein [Spartinivicinus sp. A2-2]